MVDGFSACDLRWCHSSWKYAVPYRCYQCWGGGTGGREPGVKGAGSIREAGEERAGSGILKVTGYGA